MSFNQKTVASQMIETLTDIVKAFAALRLHLAVNRDVNAAELAQIETDLEFLLSQAKSLRDNS